ncbi:c-type cytochrome [Burkholderia stagnalis]|uniref:c-type cytochrome n=1 Tax=Burkholderia stagnalis TaxID=1503054 RepID=UPI000754EA9C|nr:cytochrome c [Burkholderia stagnalis]KVO58449.1 cytochrome C [Burkholderia stagnalis]KVP10565.1 cytochrome C [Burkholderia stagnalis]KVW98193.1 cytochrome C [Burkholderia stagnalis]KWH83865.1 cytochrome C [Burkholderia stagnalis]KWK25303.1 cytochrome C [Burkholderia stagnalis]
MSAPPFADWTLAFLQVLYRAQVALAQVLRVAGATGDADGQAAWPWPQRIALETLRIDAGLTRQLALAFALTALAAAFALAALVLRRRRVVWAGAAVLAGVCAPWPPAALWLAPAVPTSFQRSPAPLSVTNLTRGAQLYGRHCVACHGADGRGEGPLAASLAHWPPTFAGALLARRLDGELYWRVRHGLHDAQRTASIPGFDTTFSAPDTWALLDYLKALAAGSGAQAGGAWPAPVALPALDVRCGEHGAIQALERWRDGQRVRVVALAPGAPPPAEDARWQTLLVTRNAVAPPAAHGRANCVAATADAWRVFATIAGLAPDALGGTQFLADRAGWLRARALPGQAGWSDADLLCRAGDTGPAAAAPGIAGSTAGRDPLTALLLRFDADPVRDVQAGLPH